MTDLQIERPEEKLVLVKDLDDERTYVCGVGESSSNNRIDTLFTVVDELPEHITITNEDTVSLETDLPEHIKEELPEHDLYVLDGF